MVADDTIRGATEGRLNGVPNGHVNGSTSGQPNGTTTNCHSTATQSIAIGNTNDTPSHPPQAVVDIIIVGAGNFGAATGLELAKRFPNLLITLIDSTEFPNPRAASHDVNKIVRDDYPDPLYSRMMKDAMPIWRAHPLYFPFYHQVGMLRADPSKFAEKAMATYKAVGTHNEARFLDVDDVRKLWNGSFKDTDFGDLRQIFYNPSVGFGEADKALGAVTQAAVDHGVTYKIGEVSRLTFDKSDKCTGVELETGEVLHSQKVLLATGARTSALLAKSAPDNKALHAGDRLVATGAVSFKAKISGDLLKKLASIPVLKNCLPSVKGEGMSIVGDGTIKFNCDMCFTNMTKCSYTGGQVSVASEDADRNTWTGPQFIQYFMDRARKTIVKLYGPSFHNVPIDSYRVCWDASTPTHDFLITPHPHCDGLYVASGGSFHGWKFLPVIGRYIADMLQGTLPAEYAERWAWDKTSGDGHSANPTYDIAGDLKNFC